MVDCMLHNDGLVKVITAHGWYTNASMAQEPQRFLWACACKTQSSTQQCIPRWLLVYHWLALPFVGMLVPVDCFNEYHWATNFRGDLTWQLANFAHFEEFLEVILENNKFARLLQWNICSFAVPVEKHEQFQEQFQNILDRVLKTEYQNNHCNTNIVTLHNVGWEAFILIFKASYELLHVSSGGSSLTREAGLTNVACIIRNQICEEYTIKTSIHFCYWIITTSTVSWTLSIMIHRLWTREHVVKAAFDCNNKFSNSGIEIQYLGRRN